MSYWGKLLGGVAGFVLGGPLGAMMGAALGHRADGGSMPRLDLRHLFTADAFGPARLAGVLGNRDQVFALAVVTLSAKLAKCDGPVNRAEIDAFKTHFRIPPESLRDIGRLFDRARESPEGFETYAAELGRSFADNKALLGDVLGALFAIARADRPVDAAEHDMLRRIHHAFGLDHLAWDQARGAMARPAPTDAGAEDAYRVLGTTRAASSEALRAAWLARVRENHPDRMAAQGANPDAVKAAGERMARVNVAWDRIKRERGIN